MNVTLRRLLLPPALVLLLILAACGGNRPAATPTDEPVVEAPTRTPRPTREPTAEPEPAPTEEPEPTPTEEPAPTADSGSGSSSGEVLAVQFGTLQTFAHPSGVFSIDIPENWALQNNDKADEIIHIWTDPTRNGGVIVDIFEDETVYTAEQLADILRSFLENSFGGERDFSVDTEPTEQSDGSVLLAWSYLATADNNADVELLGNSFIEQRQNKVSILTTLIPADQFDATVENTNEIINTYRLDPSASIGGTGSDSGFTGGSTGSGELPATIVGIGEPVAVGNLTLTVTGVEEPAGSDFFQPDAGNKFIIVRTVFENSGSSEEVVSTLLQMSLVDAAGTKYDLDILAAALADQTPDGSVPAGGSLEGGVGFQVPADATGLVFIFEPLLGGEPVGVALD